MGRSRLTPRIFKHCTVQKTLLTVTGPTAVGKTALTVELAQKLNTQIVSCDSRQFYRELSIGTAKPTPLETRGVPHHFIDHKSITCEYSAGEFEKDAVQCVTSLFDKHDVVILTGGSGLYMNVVLFGLDDFPDVTTEAKNKIARLYKTGGLEAMQAQLKSRDPVYYQKVDLQNPARLRRALELMESTGRPFSSFQRSKPKDRPWKNEVFVLNRDRAELHERINTRVDEMVKAGLFEEAQQLKELKHLKALQTVGYKEIFEFFAGKTDKQTCIELIKRNTRRYAKRQITWFRSLPDSKFIYPPFKEILNYDPGAK